MTFIVFLRAVSDAGFYFFFAGTLACAFGARPLALALGLALQCAALTAGYLFRGKHLRFVPLAVPVLYLILGAVGAAERLMLAAFLLYVLQVLRAETYEPTWDHEADLFSKFWKLALGILLVWVAFGDLFGGGHELLRAAALPGALVTMTGLILLMRALRHDRDVYTKSRRQLIDIAIFALLLAISAILSSDPVLNGLWWAVKLLYAYLLQPVLEAGLWVLMQIIRLVIWLLSFIMDDGPLEMPDMGMGQAGTGEEQPLIPEMTEPGQGAAILRTLLILAGAAVVVFLAYRLLRMLFLRGPQAAASGEEAIERDQLTEPDEPRSKARSRAPEERVRRAYRKFLRLCRQQGLPPRPRDTSLTMERRASPLSAPDPLRELRTLYIAARYDNTAPSDAGDRAEEAVRQIKKEWHQGEK